MRASGKSRRPLRGALAAGIGVGIALSALLFTNALATWRGATAAFPSPEKLVWLNEGTLPTAGVNYVFLRDFLVWRSGLGSFAEIGAFRTASASVQRLGGPARETVIQATPGLLALLNENSGPKTITAGQAWLFPSASQPSGLAPSPPPDQSVEIAGMPYRVMGVLPRGFQIPATPSADILVALPEIEHPGKGLQMVKVVGRLSAPGGAGELAAALASIEAKLEREHPELANLGAHPTVQSLGAYLRKPLRASVSWELAGATVLFVLTLIDAAVLVAFMASDRAPQRYIRLCLGAGYSRLLAESLAWSARLVLPALGVLVAVLFGADKIASAILAVPKNTGLRPGALVFAVAVAMLAFTWCVIAVTAERVANRANSTRSPARGIKLAQVAALRVGSLATMVQSALSVLLVSICLVVAARYLNARYLHLGFAPHNLFAAKIKLSTGSTPGHLPLLLSRVQQRLEGTGAISAGWTSNLPPASTPGLLRVTVIGGAPVRANLSMAARAWATPGFFQTMRIPFLFGHDLPPRGSLDRTTPVVINQAFRREFFGSASPVGRKIRLGGPLSPPLEIVGVVADFENSGAYSSPAPEAYEAYRDAPDGVAANFVLRTNLPRASAAAALSVALARAGQAGATFALTPFSERLEDATNAGRVAAQLALLGTLAALLLAFAGTLASAYVAVSSMRRATAIRLALGAPRLLVARELAIAAGRPGLAGITIGLLLAGWAFRPLILSTRIGSGWVEIALAIFATSCALVAGAALPSAEAVRTDPLSVLRTE